MTSLKDRILKGSIPTETITAPDWGMLTVRGLTGKERDQFDARYIRCQTTGNYDGLRSWAVSLCILDENGDRLLSDSDVESLNNAPGRSIDAVFSAIKRLSGLTDQEVEELEKNSSGGANA